MHSHLTSFMSTPLVSIKMNLIVLICILEEFYGWDKEGFPDNYYQVVIIINFCKVRLRTLCIRVVPINSKYLFALKKLRWLKLKTCCFVPTQKYIVMIRPCVDNRQISPSSTDAANSRPS